MMVMLNTFYVIFGALLTATLTSQAPIDGDEKHPSQNLANIDPTQTLSKTPSHPTEILYAAENSHHFAKRETTAGAPNALDASDDDETMNTAADTVYIPYVRYRRYYGQRRRIYPSRFDNYPALVGYADDRDRFPTVA